MSCLRRHPGYEWQIQRVFDTLLGGHGLKRKHPSGHSREDRAAFLAARFEEDYLLYQYCFVEFFLEHLGDVSASFKGDLQQVLILGLIGQVRLNAVKRAVTAGRDPSDIDPLETVITASRLADVSRIPRQTVRRKLLLLETEGWIEQVEDGSWYLIVDPESGGASAKRDLEALDRRARVRVARLVADLEAVADWCDR